MKPGEIVLVHFPQTNLAPGKLRPALIVADTPDDHDDVLLALITSRLYQAVSDFDEIISPKDSDYVTSRLKKPSVIRLSRLATVERASIEARLGRISPDRLSRSRIALANWLLASPLS